MINSPAIQSKNPSQASQPNNVRKCPVLSGPTADIQSNTSCRKCWGCRNMQALLAQAGCVWEGSD